MQPQSIRRRILAFTVTAVGSCVLSVLAAAGGDDPKKLEVHEWSVWVADPNVENANARDRYPSALPTSVSTTRTNPTAKGDAAKGDLPVAPLAVLSFYGEPVKELEVSLQPQAGQIVAHWPAADVKNRRLRWPPFDLNAQPGEKGSLLSVSDEHWFHRARKLETLWVNLGARTERFLAYDAEFKFPLPFKLEGGPEKYRITNTSTLELHDLVVVTPTAEGRRVGWLDIVPAGRAEPAAKSAAATPPTEKPAEQPKPKDEPKAKADAEKVPPEVEAKLKTLVTLEFVDTPLKDVVDFIRESTKLEVRLNEQELKDAGVKPEAPITLKLENVPLRDVIQQVVVQLKLEYQIDEKGTLIIPKPKSGGAAQAPAGATEPGVTVELTMSEPLKDGSPELQSATTAALAERLGRAGLNQHEIDLIASVYSKPFFESPGLVVLFRLPAGAIDEKLPLDVFPEPKKVVRVAVVVARGVDPRMKDEVKELIARLGDAKYSVREAAEKRLVELGAVAVPVLKEALKATDLEVVFRAERILLSRNESIDVK